MSRRVVSAVAAAPARKVRVTGQDVALAMVVGGGLAAVESMHKANGIAPATIDKACELLESTPEHVDALRAFADANFAPGDGQRGRPAATIGTVRGYRVQEVDGSDPFIRLPVALLGLPKGATARVTFRNGSILVDGEALDD